MDDDMKSVVWRARRSGKELVRPMGQYRDPFNRDRARVIHSAAFRRLQAKTQVLGVGEGDFHRTRLTHSMEAAQISRGIVRALQANKSDGCPWKGWLPDPNLIETIALSHDLGHPPFGHSGEVALNFSMRDAGGFEGNGQTLRLLSRLESHTENYGLDLTRRCLLGILKYPVNFELVRKKNLTAVPQNARQLKRSDWKPPKCYLLSEVDVVEWLQAPFSEADKTRFRELRSDPSDTEHGKSAHHAFDTGIMELGDDIAYGIHDFEDAVALKLVSRDQWQLAMAKTDKEWAKSVGVGDLQEVGERLFGANGHQRKQAIGALVNAIIVSVDVREAATFEHPLLRWQVYLPRPAREFIDAFRSFVHEQVIDTPEVQTLEYRGEQIILSLFEALASDPERLLKDSFRMAYESVSDEVDRLRVICDYIAGMTDEYATCLYERMFVPRQGQYSDRL